MLLVNSSDSSAFVTLEFRSSEIKLQCAAHIESINSCSMKLSLEGLVIILGIFIFSFAIRYTISFRV